MRVAEERVGRQHRGRDVERVVVDQDGKSQARFLGRRADAFDLTPEARAYLADLRTMLPHAHGAVGRTAAPLAAQAPAPAGAEVLLRPQIVAELVHVQLQARVRPPHA